MAIIRDADGVAVPRPQALQELAVAAREVLIGVARRYHATITYKDLADQVEDAAGIRLTQLFRNWLSEVLYLVAAAKEHPEPELTSLVVYATTGGVGDGFGNVMDEHDVSSLDDRAALERLRCYQFFEAPDLPADGGVPAPSPAEARYRQQQRKRAAKDTPRAPCPRCGAWKPLALEFCEDCAVG